MANLLLEKLYAQHVPSAIRECERSDFDDRVFLNLGHRVIDEFWLENKANFVRHSTHKLNLDKDVDPTRLNEQVGSQAYQALLEAFLAAEVERRIEPAMTIDQREKLGSLYRSLGEKFYVGRWLGHSRFCFSRAAHIFADLRLHHIADDCWYGEAKSAMIQGNTWQRIRAVPLFLFAGFGFRPYRLVYLCLLTVILFAALYSQAEPTWTYFQCLSVSGMNYLSALGYGDIKDTLPLTQGIAMGQGMLSLVLNATLFALLVRRWFRS